MRLVKFRGMKIDGSGFAYGYFWRDTISGKTFILKGLYSSSLYSEFPIIKQVEVIPETVGQYTGLKDKSNMEIYEGDILKIPDDYDPYGMNAGDQLTVYFKEAGFRFKPKHDKFRKGYWLEYIKEYEICGNIYGINNSRKDAEK